MWLKYYQYGVKHYPINQSINQSIEIVEKQVEILYNNTSLNKPTSSGTL